MTEMLERVAKVIAEATDNAPYCVVKVGRWNVYKYINSDHEVCEFQGTHDQAETECERLNGLWVARKVLQELVKIGFEQKQFSLDSLIEAALNG